MNQLKVLRAIKRITQFKLSLKSGILQSRLSLLENGLIEPRADEKEKLAKALGVSVKEIFPGNVNSIPCKEQSCAVVAG